MKRSNSIATYLTYFLLTIFILTNITVGTAPAFAQETTPRRAHIASIEGSVLVQAAGQATALPARNNMEIKSGDRIITGRDGRAEIRYDDGSVSRIGPNSRVDISNISRSGTDGAETTIMNAQRGSVWNNAKDVVQRNSRFEVNTPAAVAGVRGTSFLTRVLPNGQTLFRGYSGLIDVGPPPPDVEPDDPEDTDAPPPPPPPPPGVPVGAFQQLGAAPDVPLPPDPDPIDYDDVDDFELGSLAEDDPDTFSEAVNQAAEQGATQFLQQVDQLLQQNQNMQQQLGDSLEQVQQTVQAPPPPPPPEPESDPDPSPTTYTLTVSSDPLAGGSVTGGGSYAAGTNISVTATAASGYTFSNWTAPVGTIANASAASTTFTMPSQNVTVTANFSPVQENYTVIVDGVSSTVILDAPLFMQDGNLWAPVRFVAEALGASVDWDNPHGDVVMSKNENIVELFYESEVLALIDGRTYCEVGFVAAGLGFYLDSWSLQDKVVTLLRSVLVSGTVKSAQAEPIEGVQVIYYNLDLDDGVASSISGSDGHFSANVPAGRYHLWFEHEDYFRYFYPGFGQAELDVIIGETYSELEMSLYPKTSEGTIEGTVELWGIPVGGTNVVAVMDNNKYANWDTWTNPGGQYSMAVPAGTYTLEAFIEDNPPVSKTGVVVEVGETTVRNFHPGAVMVSLAGDTQIGQAESRSYTATVTDSFGNNVPGVTLTFSVTSPDDTPLDNLVPPGTAVVMTDSNGQAVYTLETDGAVAAHVYSVTASINETDDGIEASDNDHINVIVLSGDATVTSVGTHYSVDNTENTIAGDDTSITTNVTVETFLGNLTKDDQAQWKVVPEGTLIGDAGEFDAAAGKGPTATLLFGDMLAVKAEDGTIKVYSIEIILGEPVLGGGSFPGTPSGMKSGVSGFTWGLYKYWLYDCTSNPWAYIYIVAFNQSNEYVQQWTIHGGRYGIGISIDYDNERFVITMDQYTSGGPIYVSWDTVRINQP